MKGAVGRLDQRAGSQIERTASAVARLASSRVWLLLRAGMVGRNESIGEHPSTYQAKQTGHISDVASPSLQRETVCD